MTYKLAGLEKASAPDSYYDEGFMRVIEDHLEWLRKAEGTMVIDIDPIIVNRFKFDLRRIMEETGITADLHWTVMRMNNLSSMMDTPKSLMTLLVPDRSRINRLLQAYKSQNKIK